MSQPQPENGPAYASEPGFTSEPEYDPAERYENGDSGALPTNAGKRRRAVESPSEAMQAARSPVGTGASPVIAQILAVAVIGLGVVAAQEAVVRSGAADAPSWTSNVIDAFDDRMAPGWTIPAGVAAIVLGVFLLLVAIKRRPRKALRLRSTTGLYLKTGDVARVLHDRLDGLDGATDVTVRATRRRVDVSVTSIAAPAANSDIADDVRSRTAGCLAAFERPPRVKVKVRNEDLA